MVYRHASASGDLTITYQTTYRAILCLEVQKERKDQTVKTVDSGIPPGRQPKLVEERRQSFIDLIDEKHSLVLDEIDTAGILR